MKGRDPLAPVRIPVLDRYTDRGTIAMGKVESGTIRSGTKVNVMPTCQGYEVDGVWKEELRASSSAPTPPAAPWPSSSARSWS